MRSDPTLRKWFNKLNRKWFGGKLPQRTKIFYSEDLIEDGKRRLPYGECDWGGGEPEIRINPLLKEQGWITVTVETLLHEMAHLAQFQRRVKGGDHGRGWERIMLGLAKRGAFSSKNGVTNAPLW